MGASLSGNCNFAEMLDNLCGGKSSAKTIRGPSYSGNLPNLIVLGGFFRFFFFLFLLHRIWNLFGRCAKRASAWNETVT